MYSVAIYSPDFSTPLTTLWHKYDFYGFSYSTEINKAGSCKFSINVRNDKAIATNFKMYNKIIVEKNGVGVFIGYIETIVAAVNVIEVSCFGILELFNKRVFSRSFQTALGDTVQSAFFAILTTANADSDTGIVAGTTDVSKAVNKVDFNRSTIFAGWQKLANLAKAEFAITPDKELNFLTKLGTDKSATLFLQYKITQINSSNLRDFNVEVQGSDTANRIHGTGNNNKIETKNDLPSQANFGLLTDVVNFAQTDSNTDLATEVQNELDNRKLEFYSPSIVVDEQKIDTDTLMLGDTVKLVLDNGFIAVNQNERIIKKDVTVSDNLKEEIKLKMMPATGNLLPSSFVNDIVSLSKRVSLIESTL